MTTTTEQSTKSSVHPQQVFEHRELDLGRGAVARVEADAEGHEALGRRLTKVRKRRKALAALPKKVRYTAEHADRHELYQLSVQSPEEDVAFLRRVYRSIRGRLPRHFREDFCGTHLLATTWIASSEDGTAEGYDIDPDPLGWGLVNNLRTLGPEASRARLVLGDVREPSRTAPDVRCAQNFSYCCFKERAELVGYLRAAHDDLAEDGVFVMDIHGGSETQEEMEEEREIAEGFTYVWDQHRYWPIQGAALNHIHFRFKDGSELFKAFTYDWRLWGLPELRDCMLDAGFSDVQVFWEGTAEDGETGNGVFSRAKRGEADLSWIAYLAALK